MVEVGDGAKTAEMGSGAWKHLKTQVGAQNANAGSKTCVGAQGCMYGLDDMCRRFKNALMRLPRTLPSGDALILI